MRAGNLRDGLKQAFPCPLGSLLVLNGVVELREVVRALPHNDRIEDRSTRRSLLDGPAQSCARSRRAVDTYQDPPGHPLTSRTPTPLLANVQRLPQQQRRASRVLPAAPCAPQRGRRQTSETTMPSSPTSSDRPSDSDRPSEPPADPH